MNPSYAFDPSHHEPGSPARQGRCTHHMRGLGTQEHPSDSGCSGEAVVSFQDGEGHWQSGCSIALEQLVEKGEIEPLGQGA
jgi:hypothetical protein